MKNYVYVIIATILYITIIVLLARKAKDIFNHPGKYNAIKGWKKYQHSFWYEPLGQYYKKFFSKNYVAPIIVCLPLMIGLIIIYFIVGYFIQKWLFVPKDVIFLHGDGLWLGMLGALFFDIVFEYWIIFHCKSPIMIACSMTAFNGRNRHGDWKKLVCGMLVASIICLPVMFAGINTYAYASDKGLAINDFWQICERHISYEDIESIETEYRASGDQTEYYFSYYITIENDEEIIDVLTYCSPEEMLFIHNQIMDTDAIIQKGTISNKTYQEMEAVIEESEVEMVKELFEID